MICRVLFRVLFIVLATSCFCAPALADWKVGGGVSNTSFVNRVRSLYNRNLAAEYVAPERSSDFGISLYVDPGPDKAHAADYGRAFVQIRRSIAPYTEAGLGIGPMVSLAIESNSGGFLSLPSPSLGDSGVGSDDFIDVPLQIDLRFAPKSRLAPFLKVGYAHHWASGDYLNRVNNKPSWGAGIAYRFRYLEFSLDFISEPAEFLFEDTSAQREIKIIPNRNELRFIFLVNIDKRKPKPRLD